MKKLLLGILIVLVLVIAVILILKIKYLKKDIFNFILEPIPKVIHKVIIEHSGNLPKFPLEPKQLQDAHDSWKNMNPEYEIKYYSMNNCREYLKKYFEDSDFLQAFDCLNAYAFKCDFFRYCVLYNEGGWYSDWKQVCLKQNLLNELDENKKNNIIILWDEGDKFYTDNKYIQNSFIGSIKNNIFLKECINQIINNIKYNYYGKHTLDCTGPGLLSYCFKKTCYKFDINLKFKNDLYIYNKSQRIIKRKCDNCSIGQDWKNGNNYNVIYNSKKMYNNFIIKNKISKIIHKTGPFKYDKIPEQIKNLFNNIKKNNKDYIINYYDDNNCYNIIKNNFPLHVLWAYNKLKPSAYKADLFRYCILYLYGGIYSDLTQDFLIKLDDLIDFDKDTLLLCEDIKLEPHNYKGIQINFMCAIPKLNIFKKCIEQIVHNCINSYYGKTALDVTGPYLFRKVLNLTNINYNIKLYEHDFNHINRGYLTNENNEKIIKVRLDNHYKILYNESNPHKSNKKTKHYYNLWRDKIIYN